MKAGRLLAVVLMIQAFSLAQPPQGKPKPSADRDKKPWQGSWTKLVEEVEAFRQIHPDKPVTLAREAPVGQLSLSDALGNPGTAGLPKITDMLTFGAAVAFGGPFARSDTWGKSEFQRTVDFEGVFKSIKTLEKKTAADYEQSLEFEFPKTSVRTVSFIYPKKTSLSKWQARVSSSSGSTVRFRARLCGIIVGDIPQAGAAALMISLDEAEPVE